MFCNAIDIFWSGSKYPFSAANPNQYPVRKEEFLIKAQKITAILLAVVIAVTMTTSAFASIGGYGSGTVGSDSGGGGGGGSGSGGGGGAAAYTPPATGTAENPAPATTTTVNNAVTAAINAAIGAAVNAAANAAASSAQASPNGGAVIKLTNVSTITAAVIQNAIRQATSRSEITTATVTVDAVENGVVLSRVYITPAAAAALTGTVNLAVSTKSQAVASAVSTFTRFFDNNIAAVSLGQRGAFGANIQLAVKLDLSKLNQQSLVFYTYDAATGRYARINATYKVDAKGYLHFVTPVGGEIVISDKPLTRK